MFENYYCLAEICLSGLVYMYCQYIVPMNVLKIFTGNPGLRWAILCNDAHFLVAKLCSDFSTA